MTHSDTQEIRVNGHGRPCPPWCISDHGQNAACMGQVEDPGIFRALYARPILGTADERPEVYATTAAGYVFVKIHSAEFFALFLEDLAGSSPEDLRELAAGVRAVAAAVAS